MNSKPISAAQLLRQAKLSAKQVEAWTPAKYNSISWELRKTWRIKEK